jgi:hypothetical protein
MDYFALGLLCAIVALCVFAVLLKMLGLNDEALWRKHRWLPRLVAFIMISGAIAAGIAVPATVYHYREAIPAAKKMAIERQQAELRARAQRELETARKRFEEMDRYLSSLRGDSLPAIGGYQGKATFLGHFPRVDEVRQVLGPPGLEQEDRGNVNWYYFLPDVRQKPNEDSDAATKSRPVIKLRFSRGRLSNIVQMVSVDSESCVSWDSESSFHFGICDLLRDRL